MSAYAEMESITLLDRFAWLSRIYATHPDEDGADMREAWKELTARLSRGSGPLKPDSGSNPDARSVCQAPNSPTETKPSAVSASWPLAEALPPSTSLWGRFKVWAHCLLTRGDHRTVIHSICREAGSTYRYYCLCGYNREHDAP